MTDTPKKNEQAATYLEVWIRSKDKVLFNGKASVVSSNNDAGPFDILVGHANIISLIYGYIYIDTGLPSQQKFDLDRGVLYVMSNRVDAHVGV